MIINVNASRHHNIEIKEGLVTSKGLPEGFIISDTNVARVYKNLIKGRKEIFLIKPGEKSKSFESYRKIIDKLSKIGENAVVAFGGGVVGDLAGFVASTYKRGIDFIQIPTTLLAMVDSSIGGKNGINLGIKKNYLGTIYQPKKILVDPLFLKTLPEKELKNGIAEIIKYFAVFGKPKKDKLINLIIECCKIKVKVIEKDEQDKGYRHVLNFGHTIGHAIELVCKLSHGEAISIGMAKELNLGEKIGLVEKGKAEKIKKLLLANRLPIEFPKNSNPKEILKILKADKKGKFVFAFDNKNYDIQLDERIVRDALK